jgi:hypothetical protein
MPLNTFWQKPLAAALAPPSERGASAFCAHPRTKSMLTFAGAFGWLKCAFHKET